MEPKSVSGDPRISKVSIVIDVIVMIAAMFVLFLARIVGGIGGFFVGLYNLIVGKKAKDASSSGEVAGRQEIPPKEDH